LTIREVLIGEERMIMEPEGATPGAVSRTDESATAHADAQDLETFGYKQELHRTLGLFSSFAAAFSYI
jgi:hypothetical protein